MEKYCSRACTREEAIELINGLVGQPFGYGIKSPDMDLYDLGFGEWIEYLTQLGKLNTACTYAIHLTGGIKVWWKNGKKAVYYWDTPCEEFHKNARQMIGLHVKRVALSDKNDLWLDLGQCTMVIITREDADESWRLFAPGSDRLHLVVSDQWHGVI